MVKSYNQKQSAAFLGISESALRRKEKRGLITGKLEGGMRWYLLSDLISLANRCLLTTTTALDGISGRIVHHKPVLKSDFVPAAPAEDPVLENMKKAREILTSDRTDGAAAFFKLITESIELMRQEQLAENKDKEKSKKEKMIANVREEYMALTSQLSSESVRERCRKLATLIHLSSGTPYQDVWNCAYDLLSREHGIDLIERHRLLSITNSHLSKLACVYNHELHRLENCLLKTASVYCPKGIL